MMSQREASLTFIEELRRRKTVTKEHIAKLNNDIIDIDIQIREIRQHLPQKPEQEQKQKQKRLVRPRMTSEEKIAHYHKLIAELKHQMDNMDKHGDGRQ